jgi:hypothetical protein
VNPRPVNHSAVAAKAIVRIQLTNTESTTENSLTMYRTRLDVRGGGDVEQSRSQSPPDYAG